MDIGALTSGLTAPVTATAAPARRAGGPTPEAANGPGDIAGRSVRVALHVDEASGRVVGQFIDRETGDVVRQVPEEEMLRLLAKTRQMLGTLLNETV